MIMMMRNYNFIFTSAHYLLGYLAYCCSYVLYQMGGSYLYLQATHAGTYVYVVVHHASGVYIGGKWLLHAYG